ncbi:hypothetical protein ACFWTC_33445 [Streptomyces sp. NPDC058619]
MTTAGAPRDPGAHQDPDPGQEHARADVLRAYAQDPWITAVPGTL